MGATYRTKNGRVAIDADAAQFLADYERGDVEPGAPLDYNGFKTTAGDYYRRLKQINAQTPPPQPAPQSVPIPSPANLTPEEIERRALEEARKIMKQKHGDEFNETDTPSTINIRAYTNAIKAVVSFVVVVVFFSLANKYGFDGYRVGKYGWQLNDCFAFPAVIVLFLALGFWARSWQEGKMLEEFKQEIQKSKEALNNGGQTNQRNKNSG